MKLKYKLANYLFWKTFKDKAEISYSRGGIDLMLKDVFNDSVNGYYVDIGCYHCVQGSNTFRLYQAGWRGINVDPNYSYQKDYGILRKNDIFLNLAVGNTERDFTYYNFKEPGYDQLNTISEESKNLSVTKFNLQEPEKRNIPCKKLSSILDQHLPKGQHIDILLVDVEGYEYDVLQSNNWEKYNPTAVVLEVSLSLNKVKSDLAVRFLEDLGYIMQAYIPFSGDMGNVLMVKKDSKLFK